MTEQFFCEQIAPLAIQAIGAVVVIIIMLSMYNYMEKNEMDF